VYVRLIVANQLVAAGLNLVDADDRVEGQKTAPFKCQRRLCAIRRRGRTRSGRHRNGGKGVLHELSAILAHKKALLR